MSFTRKVLLGIWTVCFLFTLAGAYAAIVVY